MLSPLQISLTVEQIEIIRALLYFDVFKYPLTRDELYENSAISISKDNFLKELQILIEQKLVKEEGGFIMNIKRTTLDIERRLIGNSGAKEIMSTALRYSLKIASFPFVEGVCLSGSISKNYFDKYGDIDFFVITKPNRLWICRTLLILRYKLLPKKKKKYWCTNYFIASNNLGIPDVNIFTGTELAFLLPTVNYLAYQKVIEKNNWYKMRFPNKKEATSETCVIYKPRLIQLGIEFLLKGALGNFLDSALLKFTLNHWRKKYPEMNDEDFELQFRSRKDVCKRHTHGYQNKILVHWEKKTLEFEKEFNVSLSSK